MKHSSKYLYVFFIFFINVFLTSIASDQNISAIIQDDIQEEIEIDQSFKNFITITLLQSSQTSPGLVHCYERIEQGHDTVILEDLAQAIPALLEQLQSMIKAPRPPLGTPAIVGPLSCDLSAVSEKLNELLRHIDQCCNTQNSCCAEILQDFQETWTILDSIVTTLSTFDASVVIFYNTTTLFVETVITLTEIVTTLSTIVQDLSQATTLLTDINDSLTTCCANLNADFQQTWTIVGAGFNGTFSAINNISNNTNSTFTALQEIQNTLTACCTILNNDFQQTWTILNTGFNGTFSSINSITNNTNSIFTALQDIKNTLTTCCATLNSDFQQTWTVLGAGFSGTFSSINSITNNTNGTFTVLQDIRNTLTACCATLNNDFQQTWTLLNAGFSGTFSSINSITSDAGGTFTALQDIRNTITACCATLNSDFQQTWTILGAGFNSTFSSINSITNNTNGTFTALQDIRNTLTACCATLNSDFQQTWTILGAGFNGTFSMINNITSDAGGTFTVLQDIRNTLTVCCATLNSDFQQTWTILNAFSVSSCSNTPITQADVDASGGVYTIAAPGNYFLFEDIVSNGAPLGFIIEIHSNNVTLDLCNRSISGLPGNSTSGIFIDTATNVTVKNGVIQDVLLSGLVVNGGSTDLYFDHVTTLSCGIHGFQFGTESPLVPLSNLDRITNSRMSFCSALFCSQLFAVRSPFMETDILRQNKFTLTNFGGLYAFNCSNWMFENCIFNNNMCADVYGVLFILCSNCTMLNCTVNDNQAAQFSAGLQMFESDNNYFANCSFNNNFGNGITRFTVGGGTGVAMTSCSNNVFFNCLAAGNAGEGAVGFGSESGSNNVFENCVATNNNANVAQAYGFSFDVEENVSVISCDSIANVGIFEAAGFYCTTGTGNSFENCLSVDNISSGTGAGFILRSELGSTIQNCTAKNNVSSDNVSGTSMGILLDTIGSSVFCTQCYINHNSLSNNFGGSASFGIQDVAVNASTSFVASNFAFNNGTNYSVTYPSAVLPVVSGSFSGALPATGTTGSFDNIDINP